MYMYQSISIWFLRPSGMKYTTEQWIFKNTFLKALLMIWKEFYSVLKVSLQTKVQK